MPAVDATAVPTAPSQYECPECHEASVSYVGMTEDAKTELCCRDCGHDWLHGGSQREQSARPLTHAEARARFPTKSDVSPAAAKRYERLKAEFLVHTPDPHDDVAAYWALYQQHFSDTGLPAAPPAELKSFANVDTGAHPGNMSVFNRNWNALGDTVAAQRVREVIGYLLRGPQDVPIEDRLDRLIDPRDALGLKGLRESLLTKVLCVVHPERFLPILTYTSPAGGKREIAKSVFGLELPAPEATSWTRGRLAFWSNDLLVELLGGGFADLQHAAQFLWWAKDEPA